MVPLGTLLCRLDVPTALHFNVLLIENFSNIRDIYAVTYLDDIIFYLADPVHH